MELLFSRSRIKQLPDKAPITLDDFIDDLFVGEIVCKPETQQYLRIIHCCKKRIRTPELLPIEWLEQYRWQGEPLSRLRNGKTSDYKVGNDIEKMLLADPEKTKQEITRHIGKILDNAGTVYYGTMLEAYVFSLLGISDAVGESRDAVKNGEKPKNPNLVALFCGTGAGGEAIKKKIRGMLRRKQYAKVIALFMLALIILIKYNGNGSDTEKRCVRMLIWFDSRIDYSDPAIAELYDFKRMTQGISSSHYYPFLYPFIKIYEEQNRYDIAFAIISFVRKGMPNSEKKAACECDYAAYLLLGKGCEKNTSKAIKILKRQLDQLDAEAVRAANKGAELPEEYAKVRTEILQQLEKIASQYYGEPNEKDKELLKNLLTEKSEESSKSRNIKKNDPVKPSHIMNIDASRLMPDSFISCSEKPLAPYESALSGKICLTNSNDTRAARIFLDSLFDETVLPLDTDHLEKAIYAACRDESPLSILLFFDDDEINLNDCLRLVSRLYDYAKAQPVFGERLIRLTDIYVKTGYDYAALMLDAVLSRIDDVFFRVHIVDYDKVSADRLICEAPLFLPCLADDTQDINVVIFGCSDSVRMLCREMIACCYTNRSHNVTVIGKDAQTCREKLALEAPGVFYESSRLTRIIPQFVDCDPETVDLYRLLMKRDCVGEEHRIIDAVLSGNYFVVDLGDDRLNLLFAVKLRRLLMLADRRFYYSPFIAVKCRKGNNAELGKNLAVNNRRAGEGVQNHYNLYFYGVEETVYRRDWFDIKENDFERSALNVHLSYYGAYSQEALRNYYNFSYNRDSSECKSLSLYYLLFSTGIIRTMEDFFSSRKTLASRFDTWLKESDTHIEKAMRYEHNRWSGFMLSRSWLSANLRQIEAYLGLESGKDHKQLLTQLHPFLCNWEDFAEKTEQGTVIREIQERFPELRTPVESTKKIIWDTAAILTDAPD